MFAFVVDPNLCAFHFSLKCSLFVCSLSSAHLPPSPLHVLLLGMLRFFAMLSMMFVSPSQNSQQPLSYYLSNPGGVFVS